MACVPIKKILNKGLKYQNNDIPYILELCTVLNVKFIFSIYVGKSAAKESN